jgi:hypothetical protein
MRRNRATRAVVLMALGAILVTACDDGSSTVTPSRSAASEYGEALARLKRRPSLHLTVEIDAPQSVEGLAGRYEVDYEVPDKYRTMHEEGALTIVDGTRVFHSSDNGSTWEELELPEAGVPNPRDFLSMLTEPCSVERRSDGYRVQVRSRNGTSCGKAGTALVDVDDGEIRRVEFETPTQMGLITTVLALDLTVTVEPIRAPHSG